MTIENEGRRARRFGYIDLLRFVCATSVMLFHYGFVAPIPDRDLPSSYAILPWLTLYGQFGVHIFFVISGFVIAISVEGRGFGAFIWARFLRLFPAYWMAVIFTSLVLILVGSARAPSFFESLVNLSMLQSYLGVADVDGVYSTLAVELRFYFMIALLTSLRFRSTSAFVIAIWLFCCAVSYVLPSIFGKIVLAAWAPYFLAGMTIKSLLAPKYRNLKIFLLVGAIVLEWGIVAQHADRHNAAYDTKTACLLVLAGTICVWLCSVAENPKKLLPYLTVMGAMTYPLYLFHSENGIAFMRLLIPYLPSWISIPLCIAAALLLAYFVSEGPEPLLRSWLKKKGELLFALT